jgi:tRNA pseudouridine55 synthase
VKVDGARAYDLAREGEDFELFPREVYIESLTLISTTPDNAEFSMTCGKGTYVRALCRDLAESLGACGYISALRRTAVGPFGQDNAISLDKLAEMIDSPAALTDVIAEILLPLETVLDDIPALAMKADETAKLRSGQILSFVSKPDYDRLVTAGLEGTDTALAVFQSRPVALVEIEGHKIKPVRVFNL